MKVSIIGTGYVGLVTGTCLADLGHQITCIDNDPKKIELLEKCVSPIYELGLTELIQKNYKNKSLRFSLSYEPIAESEVVILAVGTPSNEEGKANLTYLFQAIEDLIPKLTQNAALVLKSTVPVGTSRRVKEILKKNKRTDVFVVNNPEFLKEGTAVMDFLKPARVLVGAAEERALEMMEELYRPLTEVGYPLIKTSNESAELAKYAANCFLATKISFINEIARLCELTGGNIEDVRAGIGSDPRIGKHFLYPGPGFGGSCFPKDIKALLSTAKDHDLNLEIIQAALSVNDKQKSILAKKLKSHLGDLKGKKIALWGVAFKAGTDDVRDTPAFDIVKEITEAGATVSYFDPIASENFSKMLNDAGISANLVEDKYQALEGSDALLVVTEWKEFRNPDFTYIKDKMNGNLIIDGRNLYRPNDVIKEGFTYDSLGRS